MTKNSVLFYLHYNMHFVNHMLSLQNVVPYHIIYRQICSKRSPFGQ